MRRFILPLCALFLLLPSSSLEAQTDRRGDTIFVADKFLGDSAVAYQLVAKSHADSAGITPRSYESHTDYGRFYIP